MAIPRSKTELTEAIRMNYSLLKKELPGIPENLAAKKELEGHAKGSLMSVKDLLAYLVGWGQLVLKWDRKTEKGEPVDFPETGYKWNELGKLAQKFYADYRQETYQSLLVLLEGTVNDILKLVEGKTNRQLYEVAWYDKWPLGRLIQFNTSSPYQNARTRLRKWKKQKGLN